LHLEQLIPLIGDERTKNFFEFIIKAIKAGTLTEIIHFDLQVLFSFNWKTDHFLNNISILLGSDIIVKIIDYLKQYDSTVGTRFRLENVIKALNDKALKERIEGMNPFDISIIKKVLSNIERVVNVYYKQFHRVKSPYRTGLPLEPDSKLFFGRNDIFKWIETKINADKHNVLVLHGGSRTGKTSILKQLEAGQSGSVLRNRENAPIFPVFIDLQSFADCNTEIFLFTLAEKIWEKHEIFRTDIAEPKPTDFQNGLHYRAFEKFLKNVTKLLLVRNKSTLVLMLDEFETIEDLINKKKLENSIYGFLRSQMQHQNSITYILAGHYKLSEFKNAEIAVILNIADHMEVGFLSKLDTTKLITEPVKLFAIEYPQDFIEKIYMATNGHPFFVQQICNNCIEILNERREYYQMGEEVLQEAIDKSIDPGSVSVLNKLWDSSNKLEKKILKIISEKVSQGSVWLNVEEIKNEIITKEFEENEVYSAIERLNKKQLIHFDIIANRVKFAFDLFRLYILKHKHRTT
jgi:hypothetical protein